MVSGERSEQRDAVAAAIDHGITHFDTAPIYGWGASEVNLGATLKALRAEVLVTSKVNVTPEFLQTGDLRSCIIRSAKATLSRLQRDHLDFLLLHNPVAPGRTYEDPNDPRHRLIDMYPPLSPDDYLDGFVSAATELHRQGLVRQFGLGGMENDPAAVRKLLTTGHVAIFQQTYHMTNPSASLPAAVRAAGFTPNTLDPSGLAIDFDDLLDTATEAGASIISPVAAGVLTTDAFNGTPAPAVSGRGARFATEGGFTEAVKRALPLAEIAWSADMTVTEMAYRFAMSHPAARTVVGGFSSSAQVLEVAPFADRGPLAADLLAAIERCWITTTKEDIHD